LLTTPVKPLTHRKKSIRAFEDPILGGVFVETTDRSVAQTDPLPVISLFTGAGGLDLGLEAAGFQTAAYVEIDPDCRKTIARNRRWRAVETGGGDIRETSSSAILRTGGLKKGETALVVGGAPCQPFSNIGKREGTATPDGNLFRDFIRVVADCAPEGFVFENVSALAGSKHAEVLRTIEREAGAIGYRVAMRILNAADYGVPQKRSRLIAIGLRGDGGPVAMPFPTHSADPSQFADRYAAAGLRPPSIPKTWRTVRDALGSLSPSALERPDALQMRVSDLTLARMRHIRPGTRDNFKVLPVDLLPDCWKSGKHQGADTFGRLQWDEPSVTIRTCGYHPMKGRYIHPSAHRGLNTVELMRLQGFPATYRFCGGLISVGRQVGNAVPPPLAKAIGLAIRHQLWPKK